MFGFTKTDNLNSPIDRREAQNVQPCVQIPNGHETRLRVIIPVIRYDNRVRPFEINGALKCEQPFGLVPGILFGDKFYFHDLTVVTIKLAVNTEVNM